MGRNLHAIAPVGLGLTAVSAFLALLAVTRPNEAGTAEADALAPAASATAAKSLKVSATVPVRTQTPLPTATAVRPPTATPPPPTTPSAGRPITELSFMRFIDTTVIENAAGADVFFPPGMPMQVLVGRAASGEYTFFFLPPMPFVAMNGTATSGFSEHGGSGAAAGSGRFGPDPATFTFEFELSEAALHGTLRITSATGGTLLVLGWSEN